MVHILTKLVFDARMITIGCMILLASVCTFDSGLCGWTQSKTDDLDWTDGHGRTPSSNTGPTTDHFGSTSGKTLH